MTAHHLCLSFDADGTVHFHPDTEDAAKLAARFARVVRILVENPSRIQCAAGACSPAPTHECPR